MTIFTITTTPTTTLDIDRQRERRLRAATRAIQEAASMRYGLLLSQEVANDLAHSAMLCFESPLLPVSD